MGTLELDGAQGEGGGQLLRSALALSLVTGTTFRMVNIRSRRSRPGLLRQHLTAVQAAAEVGQARVTGAEVGSGQLTFAPGGVRPGVHHFAVGTAGSATLVFQTVFPALALAGAPSTVTVEGGTHNPMAPPFEFLARAYLPLVAQLGPRCAAVLERPGFYPAGGGRFRVEIGPVARLGALELADRGPIRRCRATALVAQLSGRIAERELAEVRARLGWDPAALCFAAARGAAGPGNALLLEIESERVTEVFTGFGVRGVPAERVAAEAAAEAAAYLAAGVPVGPHLADQLLLPLALGQGGVFHTVAPTDHTRTHAELLRAFLGAEIRMEDRGAGVWRVQVAGARA